MKKALRTATENENQPIRPFYATVKNKELTFEAVRIFRQIIYDYYRKNPRDLPWRNTRDPYRILVSEIMLQQTQVERVMNKYRLFIKRFPGFHSLAKAPLSEVLDVWQGLGYNRRAVALKKTGEMVIGTYNGNLPETQDELLKLPGIGNYTAAAILVFAFNRPAVLIETNIRRVFIHFFFHDTNGIPDSDLMPLIEKTIDVAHPRDWYYALMDYGVMLGKTLQNPNRRSAHYQKQSPFEGSNRQIRGRIIQTIINHQRMTGHSLAKMLHYDPSSVKENLRQLVKEGLLKQTGRWFSIA